VQSNPKYSIIIPTKSGMPYLSYAVRSALDSTFTNLEVVVSLDDTNDGSWEFLSGLSDPRLKIIRLPSSLSMSEHWDYAQIHALGEWQMFLGQDDMMLSGFEQAFEYLTNKANQAELHLIVARRAYVCWPPLEDENLKALQFWETEDVTTRDSEKFAARALLSDISYHAGPQMYTTTLVRKSVVDQIRADNNGGLILGHPQDAYLGASLLKKCPAFLFSGRPFSWVGTSSSSAGLAISRLKQGGHEKIAQQYLESVKGSKSLIYDAKSDFRHGINSLYFFDALENVWPEILANKKIFGRWFMIRLDAHILASAPKSPAVEIDPRGLMVSMEYFALKKLLSLWMEVGLEVRHLFARVISRWLGRLRPRKFRFTSFESLGSQEELYEFARKISADPVEQIPPKKNLG